MITASQFVNAHSSFWEHCFPALESYIRVVNSGAYERFFEEMVWPVEPHRSALISEVAYCLLNSQLLASDFEAAYLRARSRLNGLPGVIDDGVPLSEVEKTAASNLATRIRSIVNQINTNAIRITLDPVFAGCGLLSKSNGDILAGNLLIELKNVDRGFRATDFRQLMTYVFQNAAASNNEIGRICITNARKGIAHIADLDQFIYDTSASNFVDIYSKFLASVGLGGISR